MYRLATHVWVRDCMWWVGRGKVQVSERCVRLIFFGSGGHIQSGKCVIYHRMKSNSSAGVLPATTSVLSKEMAVSNTHAGIK